MSTPEQDAQETVRIRENVEETARLDASSRGPVLLGIHLSLAWLLIGTFFGDIASIKMHLPDWLAQSPWLTFGRIRPAHLNAMIYGWATSAMFAASLWMIPRLVRLPLQRVAFAYWGIILTNIGVAIGIVRLLVGYTDGMEWLELDRYYADPLIATGVVLVGLSLGATIDRRTVKHLYVSVWYVAAAYLWFPFIFIVGNLPIYKGAESAAVNWFYAHNALGLWLTAVNLGIIYYLIPKIVGRPIYSYWLSLLGFWGLAFFYALNGMHHLVAGPLPTWMITTSIVASIMMFIPVLAVGVNQHMTMVGRFVALRYSPALIFIVFAAMAYTAVSLQGIMSALVEVQRVTHFTHWTIAHSHVGVYLFVTFTLFGALYYMMPRLAGREWPSALLVRAHVWLVASGMIIYVLALSWGGVRQGLALLDPATPFQTSVEVTIPWLWVRSGAALLLSLGHVVFVSHLYWILSGHGRQREIPVLYELRPVVVTPHAAAAAEKAKS